MKRFCFFQVIAIIACLSPSLKGNCQAETLNRFSSRDSVTRGKYTVILVSNEPSFSPITKQRLIDAFFTVYPLEAQRFNTNTLTHVVFAIDTAYKGVAATGGGVVSFNPVWLTKHPEDIDVVTHEVMHIVQDYHGRTPGWLTEGIADYARYVYGINNATGDWQLPPYNSTQSYRNAYRVTARFLVWVEKKKDAHIADELNYALRTGNYTPALWVKLTGNTVDELWSEYSKDPAVELSYK
jgi:hypothetical protein